MNEKTAALVQEAMKDETFAKKLSEAETPEAAQAVFASRGIEFTLDEVKAIGAAVQAQDGELNEDELENVSGGVVVLGPILGCIAATIAVRAARKWRW